MSFAIDKHPADPKLRARARCAETAKVNWANFAHAAAAAQDKREAHHHKATIGHELIQALREKASYPR